MTDNDRKVALMNERAELKREKCCLRNEVREAGLSFKQNEQKARSVLEGLLELKKIRFATYPTYEEIAEKVNRIADVEVRIKEIEDCVPELKP